MDKLNGPEPDSANSVHLAANLVAQSNQEFYETMLKERRRLNREIPVPTVHECDSDSVWAEFESMLKIQADTNQTR